MEAYSLDLRKRVLAACDAGHGTRQVAQMFDVSPAWVRRLKQRRRESGIIDALPRNSGRKPALDDAGLQLLRDLVAQQPDATLEELAAQLPVRICISSLWKTLGKLKLPFKKSPSTRPNKNARTCGSCERSGTTNSKQ